MSRKVTRAEIVDYQTYTDQRDEVRARVMAVKAVRRIHVGEYLTFLFENTDTVRYQIQEMMRVEQIVRDAEIQHEIDTYNELLGGPGGLGATVLIEIDDPEERDRLLPRWLKVPAHFYALLDDGTKVRAEFDERQVGETRVSSVHYLRFALGGRTPVAIGCDHAELTAEATLSEEQRGALEADLS